MRERGRRRGAARSPGRRARPRTTAGRRVFSALGSRAERLPQRRAARAVARGPRQRRRARRAAPPLRRSRAARARASCSPRSSTPSVDGAAPLLDAVPGMAERDAAARRDRDPAVPARQRRPRHDLPASSRELERRGHTVSVWLARPGGLPRARVGRRVAARPDPRVVRAARRARLQGLRRLARRRRRARDRLADRLPGAARSTGCRARAYLVQDHEPEFYATSAEARWAEETYRQGLHHICASPWLARPGARALRRQRVASSSSASTRDVYRPRRRSRGAATPSSSTGAR